jgi:murein DD-endopeptidase MepM/ murein hydrolase activator NlpD
MRCTETLQSSRVVLTVRLRTGAAILLMVTSSGLVSLPASAANDAKAKTDAAVAIPATSSDTALTDRLQSTLPGAAEAQAAKVTAETAAMTKRAIAARAAAAKRASRARAVRIAKSQLRMAIPAYGHISASFGSRGHWSTRHTGMDINARYGDTVHNIVSGTVIKTAYDSSYGRVVVVRGHGVDIWYAHLSRDYVRVGQKLGTGQRIGRVGCTGHCTGPHLHIEVRKNDLPTNPATFLWGSHRGKPGDTPAWARYHIATLHSL